MYWDNIEAVGDGVLRSSDSPEIHLLRYSYTIVIKIVCKVEQETTKMTAG